MKPLVNKKYLLEKFLGKGGWTFALKETEVDFTGQLSPNKISKTVK
jgi:hypothetical protein